MYQLGTHCISCNCEVSGTESIDLKGKVLIGLAGINRCICGTVDYCIWLVGTTQLHDCFDVCDIKLINIGIDEFQTSLIGIIFIYFTSKLSVTACNNYCFHDVPPMNCFIIDIIPSLRVKFNSQCQTNPWKYSIIEMICVYDGQSASGASGDWIDYVLYTR